MSMSGSFKYDGQSQRNINYDVHHPMLLQPSSFNKFHGVTIVPNNSTPHMQQHTLKGQQHQQHGHFSHGSPNPNLMNMSINQRDNQNYASSFGRAGQTVLAGSPYKKEVIPFSSPREAHQVFTGNNRAETRLADQNSVGMLKAPENNHFFNNKSPLKITTVSGEHTARPLIRDPYSHSTWINPNAMKDTIQDKKYTSLIPQASTAPRTFAKPNWGNMMHNRNHDRPLNVPEPYTTIDYSKQGSVQPNSINIGQTWGDSHETTNKAYYHPNLLNRGGHMAGQ